VVSTATGTILVGPCGRWHFSFYFEDRLRKEAECFKKSNYLVTLKSIQTILLDNILHMQIT
jgi:hypothetical protein